MLPTSSGRATHLRTLTPSLPYAKHARPMSRTSPKAQTGKRKCLRMGMERRQISAFEFSCRRGSPPYAKTGSYIVYSQSRVYVISQQRSQENSAAGGGIGRES